MNFNKKVKEAGICGPVIYEGNKIGKHVQCGHYSLIRKDNIIGDNVSIGSYTEIAHHVVIEDGVSLHSRCFIPEYTVIKKNAWLGPNVVVVNDLHPQTNGKYRKGITIGEKAIIGANTTIMADIGAKAVIGAGAVVTKPVPEGETWAGNPARRLNADTTM